MTGDKLAAEPQVEANARIAAKNFYRGSSHQGDQLKAREFAYEMGYLHGHKAALRSAPDCPQKDSLRVGSVQREPERVSSASRLPEGGFDLVDSARIVDCYLHGDIKKLRNIAMAMLNEKRISATYVADTASHWIPRIEGVANHIKAMPRTDLTAGMELELRYCAGALAHLAERQVETNLPSVQREARETLADGSGSQPTVRKDGARSTSEGSEPRCGLFHYRWSSSHYPGYTVFRGNVPWVDACFVEEVAAAEYCRHRNALVDLNGSDALPPPESKPAAGSGEASPESK